MITKLQNLFHWMSLKYKKQDRVQTNKIPTQIMLSIKEDEDQLGLIITDDIAIHPILDFNLYTNAIVEIIKNSYPKFTIGIFGDWGTGKTTLMNSIHKTLQNDNSTHRIRFETWRYE